MRADRNYRWPAGENYNRAVSLLVSCLCPTHDRVPLLGRAVECFRRQTWEARELVVVYPRSDAATRSFLAGLDDRGIRGVESDVLLPPGSARNLASAHASGEWVAVWDDDDWHGPTRLAEQLGAIEASGKSGCVLYQLILYDGVTGEAFLSAERVWEGSLVIRRLALPQYPDLVRGSDTPVVERLARAGELIGLARPQLYVYVHHGANTWGRDHWRRHLLAHATPMPAADSARVRELLGEAAP
jgi:glycosyltransferase involved in cell wall biosynthesis